MMNNEDDAMMDNEGTVLVMVHKRIRKHAGYDLDSNDIKTALEQQGYPLSEEEVLNSLGHLKESGYLRAFEDVDDFSGQGSKITRYWSLEITPEGAMKAIDLMNQFRYGS